VNPHRARCLYLIININNGDLLWFLLLCSALCGRDHVYYFLDATQLARRNYPVRSIGEDDRQGRNRHVGPCETGPACRPFRRGISVTVGKSDVHGKRHWSMACGPIMTRSMWDRFGSGEVGRWRRRRGGGGNIWSFGSVSRAGQIPAIGGVGNGLRVGKSSRPNSSHRAVLRWSVSTLDGSDSFKADSLSRGVWSIRHKPSS
jgi:hypothetical protein